MRASNADAECTLTLRGADPRGAILRASLWQALDRPDRFASCLEAAGERRLGADLGRIEVEAEWTRRHGVEGLDEIVRLRFDGVVGRRSLESRGGRQSSELVAWPEWEARRRLCASAEPRVYWQSTDAEIAAAIADELGLAARVDASRRVHDRVECVGDPLVFLRRRSEEIGYRLAISDRTLYFLRQLPSSGGGLGAASRIPGSGTFRSDSFRQDAIRCDVAREALGFRVEEVCRADGSPGAVVGVLVLPLDLRYRPLCLVDLQVAAGVGIGEGSARRGLAGLDAGAAELRLRVVRCRHEWGLHPDGEHTRVELVEEGQDWSGVEELQDGLGGIDGFEL